MNEEKVPIPAHARKDNLDSKAEHRNEAPRSPRDHQVLPPRPRLPVPDFDSQTPQNPLPSGHMTSATLLRPAASVLLALGLGSCGVEKAATRAEPTKFLKSTGVDPSKKITRLPFEHAWRDPAVDLTKYKYIVVRPVTTTYLRSEQWQESKSPLVKTKRAYQKRCTALASHWDKSLRMAFSSPLCMFYKATDTSRPGTLVLEIALTEVRFYPSVPAADGSQIPSDGILSAVTGPPLCAFESRTRDAATGKLVATASDRRGPEIKILGAGDTTLAEPNEAICDEWSQQLMQRSNQEIYPTVKRKWFSIF